MDISGESVVGRAKVASWTGSANVRVVLGWARIGIALSDNSELVQGRWSTARDGSLITTFGEWIRVADRVGCLREVAGVI